MTHIIPFSRSKVILTFVKGDHWSRKVKYNIFAEIGPTHFDHSSLYRGQHWTPTMKWYGMYHRGCIRIFNYVWLENDTISTFYRSVCWTNGRFRLRRESRVCHRNTVIFTYPLKIKCQISIIWYDKKERVIINSSLQWRASHSSLLNIFQSNVNKYQ